MKWFYAEDDQQKGPVDDAELEALVREGKVRGHTLVWREGMDNWRPYSAAVPSVGATSTTPPPPPLELPPADGAVCNECGKLFAKSEVVQFGDRWVCAACKPVFLQRLREGAPLGGGTGANLSKEEILRRDYEVQLGDCLQQSWDMFKAAPGPIIGASVLVYFVLIAINLIPYLSAILSLVLTGPLIGGLWLYFVRRTRAEDADVGVAFSGFGPRFGQLLLTNVVSGILSGLCILPFIILMLVAMFGIMAAQRGGGGVPDFSAVGPAVIALGILFLFAGLAGYIYLSVCWMFALPLVADKGMAFWPAMGFARRVVLKHWWMTFLLTFVTGLVTFVGVLACGVGVLVSGPVAFGALACHYQRVFGDLAPQSD
jgi:hypothetical protein